MVTAEQLAEALFLHAVCDNEASPIRGEVASSVWNSAQEPGYGERDWRDDYREHAVGILRHVRDLRAGADGG